FNSIRLHKEGLQIQNQLFWEIRKFYPKEFAIGEYAIQFLNQKFLVELDESEASNIAMHFINAQLNNDEQVENIQLLTQKIHDIIAIIRMHNQVDVDENSLAFERLVTHLRFFFKRIENRPTENPSNPLLV
ncbi:PRD domain-containing protein, partial [Enterobacter quasiroggenkampii]|uniref:PRD domain-containing protein n=1 Tax=Enterobacter quasiroggenkampii TaxID=2497436 RepID=UPI0021D254D8